VIVGFISARRGIRAFVVGLFALSALPRASAQANQVGIGCFERLELPNYPALPRQARVQGTLKVRIDLSDGGTIESIVSTFEGSSGRTNTLFDADTEKAIRKSRFTKGCPVREITLILHFEFRDAEGSLFAFRAPNEFWIRTAPVLVNP